VSNLHIILIEDISFLVLNAIIYYLNYLRLRNIIHEVIDWSLGLVILIIGNSDGRSFLSVALLINRLFFLEERRLYVLSFIFLYLLLHKKYIFNFFIRPFLIIHHHILLKWSEIQILSRQSIMMLCFVWFSHHLCKVMDVFYKVIVMLDVQRDIIYILSLSLSLTHLISTIQHFLFIF